MVFTRVGFFNLFNFPGSCRRICLGVDKRSEVRPSRLLNKSHWRKHLGYSMFKAGTSHEKLWFFSIECFFHPCHPKMFHTSGSCWRIGLGVDKRSEVKPQPSRLLNISASHDNWKLSKCECVVRAEVLASLKLLERALLSTALLLEVKWWVSVRPWWTPPSPACCQLP